MCLRDRPDGRVLVHRGATAGCDSSAAGPAFPFVRSHAVQRRKYSNCSSKVIRVARMNMCWDTQ